MRNESPGAEGFAAPRKSLGQNFLHQASVIRSIVDAIHPAGDDTVIEIGPGRGALTRPLLDKVGLLHVVELDRDLAAIWINEAGSRKNLVAHQADILEFDLANLVKSGEKTKFRIVGNLPYNISSPILFHLISQSGVIRDMHLMFQRELVDRMTASPGSRQYGRLSVMIQQRCYTEQIMRIASGAFVPPPSVESAVVRLVPYDSPPVPVADSGAFAEIVRKAFSQRRKTIKNALQGSLNEQEISDAGVDPGARAEQLEIAEFAALAGTWFEQNQALINRSRQ